MSSSTQSCSVPQYTVMVTSATSTDTYMVADTYCTSSSCLYILGMSGADVSSYNVSVACRNRRNQIGQPYVAMQSEFSVDMQPVSPWLPSLKGVPTPVLQVGQSNVSGNTATIPCTFLDGSSHYCMVCCSPSDPSVPPDSSVYNISTTRGTEVTVSLQGLTSGQMYYCNAAATNTNSNNCTGPVVGGVKVFFSLINLESNFAVNIEFFIIYLILVGSSDATLFYKGSSVVWCAFIGTFFPQVLLRYHRLQLPQEVWQGVWSASLWQQLLHWLWCFGTEVTMTTLNPVTSCSFISKLHKQIVLEGEVI